MSRLLFILLLLVPVLPAAAETTTPAPPPSSAPLLMTVSLYFENAGRLAPETVNIPRGDLLENRIKAALDRLIAGPAGLTPTLPKNSLLRRVFIGSDRNLYLDFDRNFAESMPAGITPELVAVSSICKTVFANFNVDSLVLLMEGKEAKTLAGHLDIERPITRTGCDALVTFRRD